MDLRGLPLNDFQASPARSINPSTAYSSSLLRSAKHNYPTNVVRAAVFAADADRHERRSNAAKAAAETRARRQETKVHIVARRIVAGKGIGQRHHCYICGRGLSDRQSI